MSYNASVVKIYNANYSLARFEDNVCEVWVSLFSLHISEPLGLWTFDRGKNCRCMKNILKFTHVKT
jgi:hypothetical protein